MEPIPGGQTAKRQRAPKTVVRLLLLVSLFLNVSCSCGKQYSVMPPDAKILAFGDSITYGTGASREQSYPRLLEELTGRTVVNAGIPGETTGEGAARLPGVLDVEKPSLVILCLGGNDFLRRIDQRATEKNLRDMVLVIRGRGLPIILVGVPNLRLVVRTHPMYAKIAADYRLMYDGESLQKILSDASLKDDYVHPNGDGYRVLAENLAKLLKGAGLI